MRTVRRNLAAGVNGSGIRRIGGWDVSEETVAVQFTPVSKNVLDIVERVRPLWMAGKFGGLPGTEAGLDLFAKRINLLMKAAQLLAGILVVTCIRLEILNLLLYALEILLRFRWRFHSILSDLILKFFKGAPLQHRELRASLRQHGKNRAYKVHDPSKLGSGTSKLVPCYVFSPK